MDKYDDVFVLFLVSDTFIVHVNVNEWHDRFVNV